MMMCMLFVVVECISIVSNSLLPLSHTHSLTHTQSTFSDPIMSFVRNLIKRISEWRFNRLANSRNFAQQFDTFRVATYALHYQYLKRQDAATALEAAQIQHSQGASTSRVQATTPPSNSNTRSTTSTTSTTLEHTPKAFEWSTRFDVFDPRTSLVDADKISTLRAFEQKRAIDMHLEQQVDMLMAHAVATGGFDPYPSLLAPSPQQHPNMTAHASSPMTQDALLYSRMHQHLQSQVASEEQQIEGRPIQHPDGFTLRISRSRIDHPAAGFGVILHGRCRPGTVLCIYPGTLYYSRDVSSAAMRKQVTDGNEYLISRFDGVIIDGRHWPQQAIQEREKRRLARFAGIDTDDTDGALLKYRNPFAIANYVNHPAPGMARMRFECCVVCNRHHCMLTLAVYRDSFELLGIRVQLYNTKHASRAATLHTKHLLQTWWYVQLTLPN
jgi:hypothetical protein